MPVRPSVASNAATKEFDPEAERMTTDGDATGEAAVTFVVAAGVLSVHDLSPIELRPSILSLSAGMRYRPRPAECSGQLVNHAGFGTLAALAAART